MQGHAVTLDQVQVTYPNGFVAVHPTSLEIHAGEFFSILGPSGCGKTTLLKTVSGFLSPSSGRVLIGDADQKGITPDRRPTSLIFQNLALFPLMSVLENVAFGLEVRGIKRKVREAKAEALLDLVQLTGFASARVDDLSGGQKQRVAIARALAVEPAVLLLDEPLSALDLKLRQHMRRELRAIQQQTGVTFVYITHDQGEALAMSDRVAVMDGGRILQVGPSETLYHAPQSAFVASFVGEANCLHGTLIRTQGGHGVYDTPLGELTGTNSQSLRIGDAAFVFIRPEHLRLNHPSNPITGTVDSRVLEGATMTYQVNVGSHALKMQLANDPALHLPMSGQVSIGIDPDRVLGLPVGPLAKTGSDLEGML